MRIPHRSSTLFLSALLLLLAVSNAGAAASGTGRELPVSVTPTLKAKGVNVGWAEAHSGTPATASVYISYTGAFEGKLEVRGYTSAGVEAARSAQRLVKITKDTGGPVVFIFPEGTVLHNSTRFVVVGEDGVPAPAPKPKPQKREESVGQEAKEIFQELVQ